MPKLVLTAAGKLTKADSTVPPSRAAAVLEELPAAKCAASLASCTVTELDFRMMQLGDLRVAKFLPQVAKSIVAADFGRNLISPEAMPVIRTMTGLHTLVLADNAGILADGGVAVASSLAVMPRLENVNLSGCRMTPAAANAVCGALAGLWASSSPEGPRSLDISHSGCGNEGAGAVAALLASGCAIHTLSLRGNQIGVAGASSIAESLSAPSCNAV
jgi:hypothetical protein